MDIASLTVQDVLRRPHFKRAKIVAGARGIERVISWVHIVEVAKIGHLLNGGELILSTGVGWAAKKETRISFLKQLIDRQVAALCVELGSYLPQIPDDMIELAETNAFPLIAFTEEVRFVDITQDLHTVLYEQERKRQQEDEWIQKWLKGTLDEGEIRRHLEQNNISPVPTEGVVCIIQNTGQSSDLVQLAIRSRTVFNQLDFHLLSTVERQRLTLILRNDGKRQNWKERISNGLNSLKQTVTSTDHPHIHAGVGTFVPRLTQLPESFQNASDALKLAPLFKEKRHVFFDELHIYRIISTADQAGKLSQFVRDYLQPLLDYDKERQGEMLQTLKTFLACNGSKQETAARLFIVRQTLYHRLQKLEELLGDDFMNPEKRLAIEFALYAYEYLQMKEND